jgi:hypothetical protein
VVTVWQLAKFVSVKLASVKLAPEKSVPMQKGPPSELPQKTVEDRSLRFADERLADDKSAPASDAEDRLAEDRLAYDKFSPPKLANDKLAPGQLVKFVGVGFETIVQPLTTMSADAGVDVDKTGATNATAITRTVPVTRKRRRDMFPPSLGGDDTWVLSENLGSVACESDHEIPWFEHR